MTLEGHEQPSWHDKYDIYLPNSISISFVPGDEQMISGSEDKTVRKWDLQTGKEINEARILCEKEVCAVAVSRDGRWVITAGGNSWIDSDPPNAELKVWEIKTRITKTFRGHSQRVTCIDISADGKLLASGSTETVRIWDLDTGKLVAGPFQTAYWMGAVQFSRDPMKLAAISCFGKCLEVWDIQAQKSQCRIGKQDADGLVTSTPVFWTTNDKSIVAAFTPLADEPKTIYEFDPLTLDTIGIPFEGHNHTVTGLALSFDCTLLATTSKDYTIKLWAFESRQLLASFDIQNFPNAVILSPDLRHLAYTTFDDLKIYMCNVPPNILASIWSAQDAQSTVCTRLDTCVIPALKSYCRAVYFHPEVTYSMYALIISLNYATH